MTVISFSLELEKGKDPTAAVESLQANLPKIDGVEKSIVTEDTDRGLAEVAALIAASVVVVNQGTSLLASVKSFVKAARELIEEIDGLHKAILNIGGNTVDLVNDSDEIIAKAIEDGVALG